MGIYLSILAAVAVVVLGIGLMEVVMLEYRNPLHPQWLDRFGVAEGVTLLFMGVIGLAAAFAVAGLIGAGIHPLVSMVAAAAFAAAIATVLWRLMRGRARLRNTEQGRSPFGPLA